MFLKQQLILTKFNRPCNLKGVAGLRKQAELYPRKCWSKSPTSSSFGFNRFSSSNVKVFTICLGLWCLREQQEEHLLTAYVGHFDDQVLAKRDLLPIFAERETLFFIGVEIHVELTKDISSRSQLSYKLKKL